MSGTRLVIISGKGGVGKTTIAAATAAAAADKGYRTLLVSLDRAHNLGDVLQCSPGSAPVQVPGTHSLYAMEMDPQAELSSSWPLLKQYFSRFFAYLGAAAVEAEEMAVFPGLEELLVLTRLAELADSDKYDLIVADMAPTASSLRYLSFPDMMEGVFGKLLAWDQRMAAFLRPLQGKALKFPVPENEVYDSLRSLAKRLAELRGLLADPARTAVRLVMTPESIVLEETRRALTYLSLFGLNVDAVVINRYFPAEAVRGYLQAWGEIQNRVVASARESFADLPVHLLKFRPTEVIGVSQLLQTAAELYGETDPASFYRMSPPLIYEREEDAVILSLHLPNAGGGALDLRRREHNLTLTVEGWRRVILLPDFLAGYTIAKARLSGGYLRIRFVRNGTGGIENVDGNS